ncbi:MAG: hypothetical protein HY566_03725 [Candidatus Kerfeldbacteria bacterium]|nr:hypothetical protein [Candidatus Kerfeldbacteria bacterium]
MLQIIGIVLIVIGSANIIFIERSVFNAEAVIAGIALALIWRPVKGVGKIGIFFGLAMIGLQIWYYAALILR